MTITNPRTLNRLQAGICLASFLGCLDFTIVNTALPALQRDFTRDLAAVQWAMTLFVIALCCCMVLSARLAERYGVTKIFYCGLLLFGAASLGAGLSPSLFSLNLFRLLQGAGCAVLYTASATILVNAMPANRRGRALGLLFAANGCGLAIGPVLGGVLVSWLSWRAIFLLNIPVILLSMAFCRGAMAAAHPRKAVTLDLSGWLLLSAGLIPLLFWTSHVAEWGVITLPSLCTLLLTALMWIAFILNEKRTQQPLIDFSLLRNRSFAAACLLSVLLAVFYCSTFMLLPFQLNALFCLSDAELGVMLLPITLVMALISPLAGRIADKITPWWVMAAGFTALSASALLLSFGGSQLIYLAFALMGAGWGAILGPSVVAALANIPPSRHAQAIGISWTLHNLGGAWGLAMATQVYQAGGETAGFQHVMLGLAAAALPGIGVALRFAKRQGNSAPGVAG